MSQFNFKKHEDSYEYLKDIVDVHEGFEDEFGQVPDVNLTAYEYLHGNCNYFADALENELKEKSIDCSTELISVSGDKQNVDYSHKYVVIHNQGTDYYADIRGVFDDRNELLKEFVSDTDMDKVQIQSGSNVVGYEFEDCGADYYADCVNETACKFASENEHIKSCLDYCAKSQKANIKFNGAVAKFMNEPESNMMIAEEQFECN